MSKQFAQRVVDRLLEYGVNPEAPAPGSPDDPWRQNTGPLPPMTFGGRPGPAEDEPEAEAPAKKKKALVPPAKGSRFNWKPPQTEALLHELGGHYCFQCKQPTRGTWDTADGKLKCDTCSSELQYPKSASLRGREASAAKACPHCSSGLPPAPASTKPLTQAEDDAEWDAIIADEKRLFGEQALWGNDEQTR